MAAQTQHPQQDQQQAADARALSKTLDALLAEKGKHATSQELATVRLYEDAEQRARVARKVARAAVSL